jgi:hypothetical protein
MNPSGPNMGANKCPGCGAKIDLPLPGPQATVFTCQYCEHRIPIPAAYVPPVQPYQPAQIQIHMPSFNANAYRGASRVGAWIAILSVLPFLIIPIAIFGAQGGGCTNLKIRFSSNPFPLVCGINEHLTIDGKTSEAKDTLIVMRVNCKIEIKNSKLKGPWIIKGEGNNEITLINSTLEGTKGVIDGGDNVTINLDHSTLTTKKGNAIVAEANPHLKIGNDSEIHSGGLAMEFGYNPEIEIDHSTIEGTEGGLATKGNLKLKMLDGSSIKSDQVAIAGGDNPTITIQDKSKVSGQTGITAGYNPDVTVKDASVKGKDAAFDFNGNTKLKLRKAKIDGDQKLGSNSKVDES